MERKCRYHPEKKSEYKCSRCNAHICSECFEYRYEYVYCKRCIEGVKKIGIKLVLVGGIISTLFVLAAMNCINEIKVFTEIFSPDFLII